MAVTLVDLKAHLNITFDTDDGLLQQKLDAATAYTTAMIPGWPYWPNNTAAAAVNQAVLMLAAHLYENREASIYGTGTVASVPFGYDDLIMPYRDWAF